MSRERLGPDVQEQFRPHEVPRHAVHVVADVDEHVGVDFEDFRQDLLQPFVVAPVDSRIARHGEAESRAKGGTRTA